jgi:heptosyltransferase-3
MKALFPDVSPPRSILVICTGLIGVVLLSTPVIGSLKAHWPDATDRRTRVQTHRRDSGGNSGYQTSYPGRASCEYSQAPWHSLAPCPKVRSRLYDSYVKCRKFFCWIAGRKRIGIVAPAEQRGIKRWVLDRFVVERDQTTLVVRSGATLMRSIGISPRFAVTPPSVGDQPQRLAQLDLLPRPNAGKPVVVLHLRPRYAYKEWRIEGWRALISFLSESGFAIVLMGGGAQSESDYARDIVDGFNDKVINLVGRLTLAGTAEVIRRAKLFVGPDTSASHIAAATGTPTIALFGPTNPVRWGPWSKDWAGANPWRRTGSAKEGNVYLLQAITTCVPCSKHAAQPTFRARATVCRASMPVA